MFYFMTAVRAYGDALAGQLGFLWDLLPLCLDSYYLSSLMYIPDSFSQQQVQVQCAPVFSKCLFTDIKMKILFSNLHRIYIDAAILMLEITEIMSFEQFMQSTKLMFERHKMHLCIFIIGDDSQPADIIGYTTLKLLQHICAVVAYIKHNILS